MRIPLGLMPAVLLLGHASTTYAQNEITLIAPGGIRAALEQIIPNYERKTGRKVKATFGSGLGTKRQVASGEAFDVPVIQPPYPEVLASGNVISSSATPLASVAVGIAVKQGARKPDLSTAAAVKRLLLGAKSVSYPDPAGGAAAGVSFDETLRKLGIADQMQPTLKRAQGGANAMKMVATGEVQIGVTFVSEMNEPGIDIVGALPLEISTPTTLTGFVSSHAKDPAAAREFLEYLSSSAAAAAYQTQHMQPASQRKR